MKAEQKITPTMTVNHTETSCIAFALLSNLRKEFLPMSLPKMKKYREADTESKMAPSIALLIYSSVTFQGIFKLNNDLGLRLILELIYVFLISYCSNTNIKNGLINLLSFYNCIVDA